MLKLIKNRCTIKGGFLYLSDKEWTSAKSWTANKESKIWERKWN